MTGILFARAPFTKPVVSNVDCVEIDRLRNRRGEERRREDLKLKQFDSVLQEHKDYIVHSIHTV